MLLKLSRDDRVQANLRCPIYDVIILVERPLYSCARNFKVWAFNITERGLTQSQSNWAIQANNSGFKTKDERSEESQTRMKVKNEQVAQV